MAEVCSGREKFSSTAAPGATLLACGAGETDNKRGVPNQ